MWTPEEAFIAEALSAFLKEKGAWERRHEVAWYVDRCMAKGFCKTGDQVRLCADRYLQGKRAVTPPGTRQRKKMLKEAAALRASIPPQLTAAVAEIIAKNEKAVAQFKAGNDKAVNALIGQVMKAFKSDAVIIKELLIAAIQKG